MKNILRSKILIVFILFFIATPVIGSFIKGPDQNKKAEVSDPVEIGEADGKTIIPFSKYNYIEVYDGEKGIFIAGEEDDEINKYRYDIINHNGDVIGSFEDKGRLCEFTKKYINFTIPPEDINEPYGTSLILKTGKDITSDYEESEYSFAEINKKNNDLLIEEKNSFKVVNKDNKEIYKISKEGLSGEDNRHLCYMVRFVDNTDYITALNKDDTCSLINYKTGKEVYRTKESEEITGRICGKWVVSVNRNDNFFEEYFLNNDFTPAFDGIHTNQCHTNNKYISIAEINASGFTQSAERVFYKNGTEFDYSKYGDHVRGFAGNIMYVEKDIKKVKAVKMEGPDKGTVVREGTEICLMDFNDGIAACCDKRPDSDEYPELGEIDSSWYYKWKIVDKDYNPLTNDKFNYARETVNGYAVVGILKKDKKYLGVIDFNKNRGEI